MAEDKADCRDCPCIHQAASERPCSVTRTPAPSERPQILTFLLKSKEAEQVLDGYP